MKNVLVVLPNDNLGGAEQYLKMIAKNYSVNHKIDIVFFKNTDRNGWNDLQNNITYKSYSSKSELKGAFLFFIAQMFTLKKVKYSFVYTSHVYVNGLIGFLIKLKSLKKEHFIARESTQIFTRFKGLKLYSYKLLYKFGYSSINLLICQTQSMKDQLLSNLPKLIKKINIEHIPNPVDVEKFNEDFSIETNYLKNKYQDFIVVAGRLIYEKGFDVLIESFKLINEKNQNFKLLILGEGIERLNLENLIIKNKLSEYVFLLGHQSNVLPYFKAAKACVVSSRIEGFPNVLLQMMSQNNNVVSTKCAGGIQDISGVFLAETEQIESLKNAIHNCIQSDNSNNNQIFQNFLNERSIENFKDKLERFLN